jgi:hypothetical protein
LKVRISVVLFKIHLMIVPLPLDADNIGFFGHCLGVREPLRPACGFPRAKAPWIWNKRDYRISPTPYEVHFKSKEELE